MTALMHAAYKGDNDSLDVLITHGADVNRKSSDHGVMCLKFHLLLKICSLKFITPVVLWCLLAL